jgi:integrating conjugative element protein (TIGR03765 family)
MAKGSIAVYGALVLAWVASATAAPVVIYDGGLSYPISEYIEPITKKARPNPAGAAQTIPQKPRPILRYVVPVKTPELTPGRVATRANRKLRNVYLAQPIFIVGADRLSLRWLAANRTRLRELNAYGILVQADTVADVTKVARAAQGLNIVPVSGSDIARQLALKHYPVLISREWIEQ